MSIKRIKNTFFSIIFPSFCLTCSKHLTTDREKRYVLCALCENRITVANGFSCPRCGARLPILRNTCHPEEKFVLAAATSYSNDTVRALIHTLKYKSIRDTLTPLNGIIQQYIGNTFRNSSLDIRNFVIVPIPLHRSKERKRGFNQAVLIADILHQCLEVQPPVEVEPLKIEKHNLIKTKNSKSQTELENYEKRVQNIADSFSLKHPERVAGKNIILVDDVFTSGATMREAVRVIKQAGAKKIIAFVVAKA